MMFIRNGAFLCALSVILGAFGAHGIRDKVEPEMMAVYLTATQYFFLHSIAIILYGLFCITTKRETNTWPAKLFMLGILLFSGSLYLMVATDIKMLGAITPLGGLSFIIAWIGFGLHAKRA